MEQITIYFLLFMVYSFLGWLMEVICKLIEQKKFINRGFLIGPICPIYGYGVLGILLLIGQDTSDVIAVFLKSILICSVLEYFTSYLMEKMFHARWWDYSHRRYNINGRICLETMIPFGLLGTIIVYVVNPTIKKMIVIIPYNIRIIISTLLFIIYVVDNVISFNIMSKIKLEIKRQRSDNTELIHRHIRKFLERRSLFYRHIKSAYPKFIIVKRLKK